MDTLLSRNEFRNSVFKRDKHKCIFCDNKAVDAHHIMERRLFPDGGYYLNNGASVCAEHHLACEMTTISVEAVRDAAMIRKIVTPPHLYPDQPYDKWGNPVLPDGRRMRGELFYDESVQKILKRGGVLENFTTYVKYPRTYHLPWSPGATNDDKMMPNIEAFKDREVVVTIKMDGENTSMYTDHIHARSVDSRHHASRDWVKDFWSRMAYEIPKDWRICGENLYAKHSILYDSLPSYFLGFSVWNEVNTCLSWDHTIEWFEMLDIEPVEVLYRGFFDEDIIRETCAVVDENPDYFEGYVIRRADAFSYADFKTAVGKYVREGHVQSSEHWIYKKMHKNGMLQI